VTSYSRNDRLLVQVVKCLDLTLKNGACDPYAVACVTYTNRKTVSKRTKVRKKNDVPAVRRSVDI
jgi:Ras GTPase-activating protein 3